MNKAKLLIIGMALGFERDHELFEGLEFDEDMADLLMGNNKISKADIFSAAPNGKSIFQFSKTWESLDKVIAMIEKSGETLTHDDLTKTITDSKSAIEMAASCNSSKHVFTPELWKRHSEDFENLWFSLPKSDRNMDDFESICDRIAQLEGRKTRLAQLKEADITRQQVRTAISTGSLDTFTETMAEKGMHLTLDDLKLMDDDGDHALYAKGAWGKFEALYAELEKNGEIPDVDFWFFKRGDRKSFVDKAFEHDAEDKIFNAKVFAGRASDFLAVYDRLQDAQQAKIDVDTILSEIIEGQMNEDALLSDDLKKDQLLSPLFNEVSLGDDASPIIALGVKKTWEHMYSIIPILQAKGETISLEDLRQKSGKDNDTCLVKAARYGHFDAVMTILMMSGERLTFDDLNYKADESDVSLLEVLQEKDGLGALMVPEYWKGHAQDLISHIWENMSPAAKTKHREGFRNLLTQVNIDSLRGDRAAGGQPKPTYFP